MYKNGQGTVIALLSEYEKAIMELQKVISDIAPADLIIIVDPLTGNPDCRSIQSILTHVVSSGYSYCIYIKKLKNINEERPGKADRISVEEYKCDLDKILKFTGDTFKDIEDNDLEEIDDTRKIRTSWGKVYDIEQLTEHAIVHILRHRRQIERFKSILKI